MEKKRKRIIIIMIVLVLIAVSVLMGRKGLTAENETAISQVTSNAIAVEAQTVKSVDRKSSMSYKATIEPVEIGIVSPKMSGRVKEVLFENGKSVSKGEPLVLLDDQDIQNQLRAAQNQLVVSEANVKKAQTNLDTAQLNYNRTKALLDQGATSQASFDSVNAALQVAKADFEVSQASVEAAKISIDTAYEQIENSIIRAPINGLVDEKNVSVGQYLSSQGGGTVLAKVKDISVVEAVIQVEQTDLSHIKVGQKASVVLDGNLGEAYEGFVNIIDVTANPASRAFNCKIEVPNQNYSLRPGVAVKVEISDDQINKAILIPIEALVENEGSYSVYVEEKGIAHKRPVTIGDLVGKTVVIKTGLEDNETIITSNINRLQDGDKVEAAVMKEG